MSLKYVTKKLEDQSLEEEENLSQKECQVDDSGTESDDETEKEDGDDADSEGGDCNLDSGVSLNLRSGSNNQTGGRSRQLPSLVRQPEDQKEKIQEIVNLPHINKYPVVDDNDNHSSEEELEDIIGNSSKKKVYTSEVNPATSSIKSGFGGCSSTNPEKRKWSEVNSSGDDERSTSQCVFRAGSGSSGDEEVSGLMDGAGTGSYTPVQFCTSPPLDVYKPRKSQSPPPKLFHMSMNGQSSAGPSRQHSVDVTRVREGQRPSGAFRPRPRIIRPGGGVVEYTSLPARQEGIDIFTDEVVEDIIGEDSGHRSPNKRHRSTPKPQNIQRPCLDFEKMQQIKTKVVTSWRQGTELSLFCW